MPHYLDPKTDLVFRKIFGQHPALLKSFLNAVLPLPEGGLIETLEYLPSEEVPVIPIFKYTVVDVKCTDAHGRVFIVEMQIEWTASFMQRMLFNASKAYVRQLEKGEYYDLLRPVYGLGLIASEFDKESEDWYHHYKIVNVEKPTREIKDLQLVFIELPKFKAKTMGEKRLQVLWLRFLSELNEHTRTIPEEWLNVPEIKKAVDLAEEAGYTPGELDAYDRYWDMVSTEKTLFYDYERRGLAQGLKEGLEIAKGLEKGIETGIKIAIKKGLERGRAEAHQQLLKIARSLKTKELSDTEIAQHTGLPVEEIKKLL